MSHDDVLQWETWSVSLFDFCRLRPLLLLHQSEHSSAHCLQLLWCTGAFKALWLISVNFPQHTSVFWLAIKKLCFSNLCLFFPSFFQYNGFLLWCTTSSVFYFILFIFFICLGLFDRLNGENGGEREKKEYILRFCGSFLYFFYPWSNQLERNEFKKQHFDIYLQKEQVCLRSKHFSPSYKEHSNEM